VDRRSRLGTIPGIAIRQTAPVLTLMGLAYALLPLLMGVVACAPMNSLGTWREGYKLAHAKALSFKSWEALWDWAESESGATVLPLRMARSADLSGGRHSYIDTRSAGKKDACISILDEMRFIGSHNSGDVNHFFEIMQRYLEAQNPDGIIPPGHF
jgi:hypothetical protein